MARPQNVPWPVSNAELVNDVSRNSVPVRLKRFIVLLNYRWLLTGIFLTLLVIVSITPTQSRTDDSAFSWLVMATPMPLQKFLHVAMYATLTFLVIWAMESVQSRLTKHLVAPLVAIAIGALLEWSQTRIPGRFGTLLDVLLNGVGAILGAVAALLFL